MVSYLTSAFLGLLRDRLLAGRFGAGEELDVYYAAFTIPDLIALLFIFGAISAAIVPIFSSYWVKSKDQAWQYLVNLFNIFLTFLIVVCVILIIVAPFIVSFIAPGFSAGKRADTILLMRIIFLSPILLGISNIISGILQVFHRFLVTALAPVMYNLGIIAGILFFVPFFGLSGLAFGVVLGGLLHLLIQVHTLFYSGFKYQNIFNIHHPGVLKTLKLMAPRSLGLGAGQLNTVVITAIASTLSAGSIAVFNLANNLSSLLVNAVALSLSTAVFPAMSLAYSKEDKKDFEKKFSKAFLQMLFLVIPLCFLIFILRAQIVRVVLGVGKFGWSDTRLTAACLGVFSLGLFAQGLIFLLSKTFYAAHNTKIPALISIVTVIFNIIISFLFVWALGSFGFLHKLLDYLLKLEGVRDIRIIGLALAFSITAIAEVSLLLFFLYKKLKSFRLKELSQSLYKILISSVVMAVITLLVRQVLVQYHIISLQTFLGVFLQLVISGLAGAITYIFTSYLLKSSELKAIKEFFFRWII